MIYEPDVTLTDYLLTIECAILAWLLLRGRASRPDLRNWFVAFLLAVGAAALLGGTVHGFFPDTASLGYRLLWPTTLLVVGVGAFAAWMIGLRIRFGASTARAVAYVLGIAYLGYAAAVLLVTQDFVLAIAGYLPAALFLLVVLGNEYRRTGAQPVLVGVFALLLTFVAAAVQQAEIGLHPLYFDHNALYHVIQAVALLLLYRSATWLVGQDLGR